MRVLPICVVLLGLSAVRTTEATGQCASQDTVSAPDVRIFARVRASELRFEQRPRADVLPLGCVAADTVRVLVRTNLPEPVAPGVVYRDVEIAIEIVTRLSVLCSPELLRLIAAPIAPPRLAALCASNSQPGENRRLP